MRTRARLVVGAVVIAAATLAASSIAATAGAPRTSASAVVAPTGLVLHAGRWLVDRTGRVVIVHGVNVPTKALPAYPAALNFGDADAALVASAGLNAVRLTVERYAVEPSPGRFDDAYVAHIGATVGLLARHGILSLIDFHQDEFGTVFHDNGFPSWMTLTDGFPNLYQVGFPLQYLLNPALNRAFDHFWADDIGPSGRRLQADDATILARVVKGLAGAPGLLGYEIMNEPWPGTVYPTCLVPLVGCPLFDRGPFSAYYARVVPAVRAADPAHLIWYEPLVTFNYGIPTSVVLPPDRRLGFAFHDYSLCSATGAGAGVAGLPALPASTATLCGPEDALVVANAVARSAATGDALMQTEFGATTDAATLDQQLGQYDQGMVPWMFWSYTGYLDPYASDGTLEPPTPANINQAMLLILARPYPQLVAGTPIGWSFNPTTKVFSLRYSPKRADGHGVFPPGSETDIAVPAVQYPRGYVVTVAGGTVVSAANAPVLRVRARRRGPITVTVSAR